MGLIGSVAGIAGVVLAGLIVRLGGEELTAWMPRICQKLLDAAVLRLPPDQQDRFREEWASHLNEKPGAISKLIEAGGFHLAARRKSREFRKNSADSFSLLNLEFERRQVKSGLSAMVMMFNVQPIEVRRNVLNSALEEIGLWDLLRIKVFLLRDALEANRSTFDRFSAGLGRINGNAIASALQNNRGTVTEFTIKKTTFYPILRTSEHGWPMSRKRNNVRAYLFASLRSKGLYLSIKR